MRTKLVALFLILLVSSFLLAQTAPAPTPKPDDAKAMCACCQGDKAMKAGDKCPMMSSDKAKAGEKCPMMKEGEPGKAGDKCPMMSSDKAKAGEKCPMMSAEEKKGCCAGDKCKAGTMHEHHGN